MKQEDKDQLKTRLVQYVNACIRQEPKQIKAARKEIETFVDRITTEPTTTPLFELADDPSKAVIARAVFDWIESTHLIALRFK
jgi:hypothetical protein